MLKHNINKLLNLVHADLPDELPSLHQQYFLKCSIFHGCSSFHQSRASKQYNPRLLELINLYGPSQLGPNFPYAGSLVAKDTFLRTRSPILKCLGFTNASWYLVIKFLYRATTYSASILTLLMRSKLRQSCFSFSSSL